MSSIIEQKKIYEFYHMNYNNFVCDCLFKLIMTNLSFLLFYFKRNKKVHWFCQLDIFIKTQMSHILLILIYKTMQASNGELSLNNLIKLIFWEIDDNPITSISTSSNLLKIC
jgi:hypothetical protein